MSINRFPIVIWGTVSANAAGLLAVPTVSTACLMLWMDRHEAVYYWFPKIAGRFARFSHHARCIPLIGPSR